MPTEKKQNFKLDFKYLQVYKLFLFHVFQTSRQKMQKTKVRAPLSNNEMLGHKIGGDWS